MYLVRSNQPISSPTGSSEYQHVLKRVAVPDKETLKEVRWEVDVMVRNLKENVIFVYKLTVSLRTATRNYSEGINTLLT